MAEHVARNRKLKKTLPDFGRKVLMKDVASGSYLG
jgi:hypothetical protein